MKYLNTADKATLKRHPEFAPLFEPLFTDYVTLDPSRVEEAWEDLSKDHTLTNIALIPAILAFSFHKITGT